MNSSKKITIKWNKDLFQLDSSATTIQELKQEIAQKTQVQPDRQKILFKGKFLDDTFQLSGVPEGSTLTLMGTPNAEISLDSDKKIMFLEDLTKEEKAKLLRERGEDLVYGLKNLGNTCYLNSVLQVLGRVPELRKGLQELALKQSNQNDMSLGFSKTLGNTYRSLDTASDTVEPENLVAILRAINPLFADQEKGVYKQQDAEECWSLILNTIRDHLQNKSSGEKFSSNLIDELFGIQIDIKLTNIENNAEVKSSKEIILKLPCYIDNTTNELVAGLKQSLKENVDLYSDLLGRNTVFEKTQSINRFPPYLSIQFMRFFWKQATEANDNKGSKSKILRGVMFSKVIDLYEFASDETREILNIGRNIETKMLKDDKTFRVENVTPVEGKEMIPTGRYQLISVVTHQGRSSDSGHYVGWAHKIGDKWTKYDDDIISTVNVSDILELKGGGDWPIAYICIYRRLEVPFIEIE